MPHIAVTVDWTLDFVLGLCCGWGLFCTLISLLKVILQHLSTTATS